MNWHESVLDPSVSQQEPVKNQHNQIITHTHLQLLLSKNTDGNMPFKQLMNV